MKLYRRFSIAGALLWLVAGVGSNAHAITMTISDGAGNVRNLSGNGSVADLNVIVGSWNVIFSGGTSEQGGALLNLSTFQAEYTGNISGPETLSVEFTVNP